MSEAFDGIFAQASLLHVPKAEVGSVIKGLASRLKKDGYFYVAVKSRRPGGVEEEILTESDYGYEYARFFSYYEREEIEKYLEDSGMTIVQAFAEESSQTKWIQAIARK
jgi:hypothetical protein